MTSDHRSRDDGSPDGLFAAVGRALAHPLRVRIMKEMMVRDASASNLSEDWHEPLGNVSYHLGVLHRDLGLLTVVGRYPKRGALETVFSLPSTFSARLIATVIATVEAEMGVRPEGRFPRTLGPAHVSKTVAVDAEGEANVVGAIRDLCEAIETERRRCGEHASGPRSQLIVTSTAVRFGSGPPGRAA